MKKLRHRLGISQEDLAERADLHRTYIAGIESGGRNVTLKTVQRLAQALGVSEAELLLQTGEASVETEESGANLPNYNQARRRPKE